MLVLFLCFKHKQWKWNLWILKGNTCGAREDVTWMKSSKCFNPARDNEQTSLSCATLTHYHPQQTGCELHRALLPNDSSSCDKSFTLTHFHLLSEPLLDRWETPTMPGCQVWASWQCSGPIKLCNVWQHEPNWTPQDSVTVCRDGKATVS